MRSSVKKCPTIVCRRGVWRGLELSIKSLPLRKSKPDDENHPVFLYPELPRMLACKRQGRIQKRCAWGTSGLLLSAPAASGGGNAQPARVSKIPGIAGNAGGQISPVGSIILPRQDDGTPNPIQMPF